MKRNEFQRMLLTIVRTSTKDKENIDVHEVSDVQRLIRPKIYEEI